MSQLLTIGVLQQQKNIPSGGGEVWDYEGELTVGNGWGINILYGYFLSEFGSINPQYPDDYIYYDVRDSAYYVDSEINIAIKISINDIIIDLTYNGTNESTSALGLPNYFVEGETVNVKIKYIEI